MVLRKIYYSLSLLSTVVYKVLYDFLVILHCSMWCFISGYIFVWSNTTVFHTYRECTDC